MFFLYENLTRIPRPVDGDEWFKFCVKLGNRGGNSHEFGVMPRLVSGDSRIQTISLLSENFEKIIDRQRKSGFGQVHCNSAVKKYRG